MGIRGAVGLVGAGSRNSGIASWGIALVTVGLLSLPASALAQIIYTHGNDIWAMNDNGSTPHLLVSAADAPPTYQLQGPNVLPNGITVAFAGTTNEFQNGGGIQGDCGEGCQGIYTLSNGVVTRSSGAPGSVDDFGSFENYPTLTGDGRVIFDFITVDFSGGEASGGTSAIDVRPLSPSGQTAAAWATEPDASTGVPGLEADPANGSLLAYFTDFSASPPNVLYIGNQANQSPTALIADPWAASFAWNPGGTEFADVDGADTANAGAGDNGFSAGIWMLPAHAGAVATEVLADPNPPPGLGDPNTFNGGITFAGPSELVFEATYRGQRNLWEVPTSCQANTCSFPASAHQLTSDGNDSSPTWTAQTVAAVGGHNPPPPGETTFKLSLSASHSQKVVKQKGVVATVKCNVLCAFAAIAGIEIKGSKKKLDSKQASGRLLAGGSKKFTLKLSSGQLKTIEKALKKHKQVTAVIVADAKDLAGKTVEVHSSFTVKH